MPLVTTCLAAPDPAGEDGFMSHHPDAIAVDATNPDRCTPDHACDGHDAGHAHGEGCGHAAVPHGDHVDFVVDGHLHHPHGEHCDDHGPAHPPA